MHKLNGLKKMEKNALKKNKKANFGFRLFGFLFILVLVSGLFMFLTLGVHYLFYDYAIDPALEVATEIGVSAESQTQLTNLSTQYLNNISYMDYIFGVFLFSIILSILVGASQAKTYGIVSFFGMLTIGNMFLILLISYATQVRGWFLNNIAYAIINTSVDMPILTFFINYSEYIVVILFIVALVVNQVDFETAQEKVGGLFQKPKRFHSEGRFEE